jgi:hypothetical protein
MRPAHTIKKLLLLAFISALFVSCGPTKSGIIKKSSEKKPAWTNRHENWIEEDNSFLFIGRFEGARTKLGARKNSLSNALSHFSNYFGVTISSEFTEKTGEKNGVYNYEIDLFAKHKGTRVILKRFNVKDFYYEVRRVGKRNIYTSMMLVEVPKDEMARIEKKLKPGQEQSEWIRKIKETVSQMLKDKGKFSGKKIAVGSFTDSKKKVSELSLFIADQVEMVIISKLATDGVAEVIESEKLKQDMRSWRLGVKGRVDEENSTQAGNLLGIDTFCFGSYTLLGDTISLNIKMVDAKSGKIITGRAAVLGADKRIVKLSQKYIHTKDTFNKSSSEDKVENGDEPDVTTAEPPKKDTIKVEIWTEKDKFSNGDKIKFFVRADRDCYLSLVHVDALGKVKILFPNYYAPSNFVKGKRTYSVPSENAGFDFVASEPFGYEIVRAIASKTRQLDIKDTMSVEKVKREADNIFSKTQKISEDSPFASFAADAAMVTRGISVTAQKAKKGDWAEAVIRIKITP